MTSQTYVSRLVAVQESFARLLHVAFITHQLVAAVTRTRESTSDVQALRVLVRAIVAQQGAATFITF